MKGRGIGLVGICRGSSSKQQGEVGNLYAGHGEPGRFDTHSGRVFVVTGNSTSALSATTAKQGCNFASIETMDRDVTGDGENAAHTAMLAKAGDPLSFPS